MFREEGNAKFDPAVNGSESDHLEESVEEVNKHPTSWDRSGCDRRRKLRCGSGCGGGRS